MKITQTFHSSRRRQEGLTLVEMMTTVAIFTLVVGAFVYANMFGLRYNELANSKLGASEQARLGFDLLTADIRSAKIWAVGNGNSSSFTPIPNGSAQAGNAVQMSPTSDTNTYARYYIDSDTNTTSNPNGRLCRIDSTGNYQILADFLTNTFGTNFQAQNYQGSNVTDLQYKYVLAAKLEFYQYQFPKTYVGPGYYYDYYCLQFKVTPHNPDGP
jgi:Tfp pilus assembly protein FimT